MNENHPQTLGLRVVFDQRGGLRQVSLSGLVGQGTDHEADNRARGNRGQDGIAAVIIVYPVIAVRRIIQAPIIIITNDDRITVVAIMAANPVTWHVIAIIHEAESWPRIIIERSVPVIIIGARRIVAEVVAAPVPTVMIAIVVAIMSVEVAVVTPVPAVIAMSVIAMPAIVPVASRLAISTIIAAIIGPVANASVLTAVFGASFGAPLLTALKAAIIATLFAPALFWGLVFCGAMTGAAVSVALVVFGSSE